MKQVLSLVFVLFTIPAWGSTPMDLAMKHARFEDINAAANYLLAVVDGSLKNPPAAKKLKCEPSAETAQAWMSGPMHAISDAKTEEAQKVYNAHPKSFTARIKTCAKSCSCNAYVALLDGADEKVKKTKAYEADHKMAADLAAKEDTAKSLSCAKAYHSLCGSDLEKYLKADE